ncbi:hypothetical protein [Pedobacter sp. Leaf170]|uniref:hypothetical protein n=1 Tax=Pedobacter sp. Leaf170 TaxID=2876558 RepID=UPI001E37971F|nr:hypothetical protein [Pedobacter sp. Leaf170]
MRTGIDIVKDVKSLLEVPELTSLIDGKIWMFNRPQNSDKTDITIGVLASDNDWMQQATINIRIHAKNPALTFPGSNSVDNTMPNLQVFEPLIKKVCELTDTQFKSKFNTSVANAGELYRQNDGSYVALVQLDYYSIQENFKNI